MAFSYVIEDGSGVAGANGYVTLAAASDYIEANANAFLVWDALSDDQKERVLVWATRYIEYRMAFEGTKLNETYILAWPRSYAYDHENILITDTTIPIRLQYAIMELTRFLLARDLGEPLDSAGIEKLVVDVIEITFTTGYTAITIPNDVFLLIEDLGSVKNANGSSFGKIVRS